MTDIELMNETNIKLGLADGINLKQVLSDEEIDIARNTNIEEYTYIGPDKDTDRTIYFSCIFYTRKAADGTIENISRSTTGKPVSKDEVAHMSKKVVTLEEYIKEYIILTEGMGIAKVLFYNFMKKER